MVTKKDVQKIVDKSAKETRKEFKENIETAVAQVIEAVMTHCAMKNDLKSLATKDDLKTLATKDDLGRVEADIKDIKRQINDFKVDTPTPQEFTKHEERIKKLETAVFPS